MTDVLLIGEAMALFSAEEHGTLDKVDLFRKSVSGAEVNVAIGLSRLGYNPTYITRLGDDMLGKYIANFIKSEHVNIDHIEYTSDFLTGIQLKSKEKQGDAFAPYFRKRSAASTIDPSLLNGVNFDTVKHVHLTGIPCAISLSARNTVYRVLEIAREKKIPVTFDPNIRMDLWESVESMREVMFNIAARSDVFLPGLSEAELLTGRQGKDEVLNALNQLGIKRVVMKVGAEGAYVMDHDFRAQVSGFDVQTVVDTVGAGDGFAVGVIYGLLNHKPLDECAIYGNAIGAMQVTHWSDNQGLPSKDKLHNFVDNQKSA